MDLEKRGLVVQSQVAIPVVYEGLTLGIGFRADIIVASKVLLEIKSIACVKDVHRKQVLTYLRLSHLRLGYVLNFGEGLLKNGNIRIVNQLPEKEKSKVTTQGVFWVLYPKGVTYSSPGLAYPPTLGKTRRKFYPEGVASDVGCDVED